MCKFVNSNAHKNLKHLERQTIRLQLRLVNMKVLAMCVPKHSSKIPQHTWIVYATRWLGVS
jgi:hypothetical protein